MAAYLGFSVPVVVAGVLSVHLGTLRTVTGAACLFAVVGGGAVAAMWRSSREHDGPRRNMRQWS
ncbi:hypothetical protein ACQPXS_46680 (plasmid) [Streptomyces sp. CA-142005]|uniref:hypothetical protein n=1 Tax=Streptomyces sp. CA-142005 TaxID=3240052 RepID=UPI003D8FC35C